MCSIVGLQGNFKADDLIAMLKTSKNRGKDASGIFLDGKIQKGIDLNDFNDENAYYLGLGHNLLAVHNLENRTSHTQPIAKNTLTLVFNGEIYNYSSLKNLLAKLTKNDNINSDSELLINLIDFYLKIFPEAAKLSKSCQHLLKILLQLHSNPQPFLKQPV